MNTRNSREEFQSNITKLTRSNQSLGQCVVEAPALSFAQLLDWKRLPRRQQNKNQFPVRKPVANAALTIKKIYDKQRFSMRRRPRKR